MYCRNSPIESQSLDINLSGDFYDFRGFRLTLTLILDYIGIYCTSHVVTGLYLARSINNLIPIRVTILILDLTSEISDFFTSNLTLTIRPGSSGHKVRLCHISVGFQVTIGEVKALEIADKIILQFSRKRS